jgi:hypothetical protein
MIVQHSHFYFALTKESVNEVILEVGFFWMLPQC